MARAICFYRQLPLQAGKSTFIKQLKVIEAEKAGEEAFSEEEIQNCRNAMAANVVSAVITLAENVSDTRRQASVHELKHENFVNIRLLKYHSLHQAFFSEFGNTIQEIYDLGDEPDPDKVRLMTEKIGCCFITLTNQIQGLKGIR